MRILVICECKDTTYSCSSSSSSSTSSSSSSSSSSSTSSTVSDSSFLFFPNNPIPFLLASFHATLDASLPVISALVSKPQDR